MKKLQLAFVLAVLSSFALTYAAQAISVEVACNPWEIPYTGGSTTIRVTASDPADGTVTVRTPGDDDPSTVNIAITTPGETVEVVYPDDFPAPASTAELGEYVVVVFLTDEYACKFWVKFTVIPEGPLGTLMATVACFVAAAGFVRIKRRSK